MDGIIEIDEIVNLKNEGDCIINFCNKKKYLTNIEETGIEPFCSFLAERGLVLDPEHNVISDWKDVKWDESNFVIYIHENLLEQINIQPYLPTSINMN